VGGMGGWERATSCPLSFFLPSLSAPAAAAGRRLSPASERYLATREKHRRGIITVIITCDLPPLPPPPPPPCARSTMRRHIGRRSRNNSRRGNYGATRFEREREREGGREREREKEREREREGGRDPFCVTSKESKIVKDPRRVPN